MFQTVLIRRGSNANLVISSVGELDFCATLKQLFIGTSTDNLKVISGSVTTNLGKVILY